MSRIRYALMFSSPAVAAAAPLADVPALARTAGPGAATTPSAATASVEHQDPGADHGLLAPTALTQPGGTVTGSLYEIFGAGITYGIVDRVQLTGVGVAPIDGYTRLLTNLKLQVLRRGRTRLAIYGGLTYSTGQDSYVLPPDPKKPMQTKPEGTETVLSPLAGAALTVCLSDDCHDNFSATAVVRRNLEDGQWSTDVHYGASFFHRMTEHSKLIVEVDKIGDDAARIGSYLPAGGVRMFWKHLAGDIGFMLVPYINNRNETNYLPLPYVSVSARF